jgi:hypothetical protein
MSRFFVEKADGGIDAITADAVSTEGNSLIFSARLLVPIAIYAPRTWKRVYIEGADITSTPAPESETRQPRIPSRF